MSVLKDLEPKLVWKQFDEIRKIPRCSKHEENIKKYLLDFAKDHGLKTKTDTVGNIVIIRPASKDMHDTPTVVLQGHMDMVCEKNSDIDHDFSKDPIKLKKEGDIITADGTTLGADNGIGIAAALAILEDTSIKCGKIEALFTVDEETGLTGAFALGSDMLTGRILLNLDSEDWGVITVGCAGGGNSDILLPIKTMQPLKDYIWLQLKITGLRGGHSGVDAHEQRANAIKLIARLLWKVDGYHDILLGDLQGGDKHNAIPREASAIIGVKPDEEETIATLLRHEAEGIAVEFKPIDPKFTLKISEGKPPAFIFERASQKTVVNMLHALPHGVKKMSYDISGLVQTSTNLAKVSITKDTMKIVLSSRSSIMTELQDLRDQIHAIVNLCGGQVEEEEPYPGWKPDLDSNVLKLAKKVYKKKYGKDPVVEAIHAGLECGIIGEKYDGMDMISIGPTIKYPHSPEEQVHVSTVGKFYDFVIDILKNV
ncbi:MAG: aminoacyl-histidine dipeptidase [Candidatus Thermoplasmatota archaeon]|nr:aminoacyl-histidine dipeptidase [Candidatus Thermoplasmatota archaeon]